MSSQALKLKGLELWCKKQTDGYPGVEVRNMTSSWRDGLAFCALIHRFRPDIMDFHSLSKENVIENNALAFRIAEKEMGIPALLEAEDMIAMAIPDRLSVITYVSQYYNALRNETPEGGPDVKRFKTDIKRPASTTPGSQPDSKKPCDEKVLSPTSARSSLGVNCYECGKKVYILERHMSGSKLYHRTCFRERRLSNKASKPITNGSPSSRGTFLARPTIPTALLDKNDADKRETSHGKSALITKTVKGPIQGTVVSIHDNESSSKLSNTSKLNGNAASAQPHVRVVVGKRDEKQNEKPNVKKYDLPKERKVPGVLARWPPAQDKGHEPMDVEQNTIQKPVPSPRTKYQPSEDVAVSKVAPSKVLYSQIDFSKKKQKAEDKEVKAGLLQSLAAVRKGQVEVHSDEKDGASPTPNTTSSSDIRQSYQTTAQIDTKPTNLDEAQENKNTPSVVSTYLRRISEVENQNTVIVKTEKKKPNFYTSPVLKSVEKLDDTQKPLVVRRKPSLKDDDSNSSHSRMSSAESYPDLLNPFADEEIEEKPTINLVQGKTTDSPSTPSKKRAAPPRPPQPSRVSTSNKPTAGPSKPISHENMDVQKTKKLDDALMKKKSSNPFLDDDQSDSDIFDDDEFSPEKTSTGRFTPNELPKGATNQLSTNISAGNVKSKSVESLKMIDSPKLTVVMREKELVDNLKNEELERSLSDVENRHSFPEPSQKSKNISKPVSPARRTRAPPPPKNRQLPKLPDPGPRPKKPPRSMFYDEELAAREKELKELDNRRKINVESFKSSSSPEQSNDRRKILPSHEFSFNSSLNSSSKGGDSSLNNSIRNETDDDIHLYSEIGPKGKRPAPPRPLPPMRKVNAPLSLEEIEKEMDEINEKQTKLEQKGRILEEAIRDAELAETSNEESLMMKWFLLVNEKNHLVRREAELIHLAREQELEAEHNNIEYELRQLMHKQEAQKSSEDKAREEELLKQLLDLVDRRNSIVNIMDEDRLRHEEEDKKIEEMMARKFPGGSQENTKPKQKTKRKKKKEKKKSKHIGNLLSCASGKHDTM